MQTLYCPLWAVIMFSFEGKKNLQLTYNVDVPSPIVHPDRMTIFDIIGLCRAGTVFDYVTYNERFCRDY